MWPSFFGKLIEQVFIFRRLPSPPKAPIIYGGVGFSFQAQVRLQVQSQALDLKFFKLGTRFKTTPTLKVLRPCLSYMKDTKLTVQKLKKHEKFYHQPGHSRIYPTCGQTLVGVFQRSPAIGGQDPSPHMSSILKGSKILVLQLKCWFKSRNIGMQYRTHVELVHEVYGTCFQYNVTNSE